MTTPKAAPYMKTWVIDEIADTAGMTQAQVGAYWLLKMAMWRAGGKLPAKDAKLADIARCSIEEWVGMKERVLGLFQRRGGAISQARMDEAITDYHDAFNSRSKGGKTTASKKANENNENAGSSAESEPQPSSANQNQNQKKERASKALSFEGSKIPKKIRDAVKAERGEAFCISWLDRSTLEDGKRIRPWSGQAVQPLGSVKCLADMGFSVLLANGEKAA